MKLSDIMRRFPQIVRPGDMLLRARDLMVWGGFRHLPVLDEDDRLVGLLTAQDIAQFQASSGESLSREDLVGMAMQRDPQHAHPDDSVIEAAARMAGDKLSCLPVLDKGKLVGMVTTTDILAAEVRAAMSPFGREGPKVDDVMTRELITVHPNDLLFDAAAKMHNHNIRHLPVVDGQGSLVGMLSDRDVRTAVGNPVAALSEDVSSRAELHVRDVMTREPLTTTPTETCAVAARAFIDHNTGALPVVDGGERLVGIVSYIDLLRVLAR